MDSKPPKCKICHKSHWVYEDHIWDNDECYSKSNAKTAEVKNSASTHEEKQLLLDAKNVLKDPSLPSKLKFDRNAYQRELMRKRRAIQKQKKD